MTTISPALSVPVASPALIVDQSGARAAERNAAVRSGFLDILPFSIGIASGGLVIGATIASGPVDNTLGWVASPLVFAGPAYLALMTMLGSAVGALTAVFTVALINARFLVYSASLAPHLRGQPAWFRLLSPHALVDPLFLATSARLETPRTARWVRYYYLSAALTIAVAWIPSIALGTVAGPLIPQSWELSFAPAAVILAMLIPTLTDRPTWIAAAAGAAVAVALIGLPNGLNLLIGTAAGAAAGLIAERMNP